MPEYINIKWVDRNDSLEFKKLLEACGHIILDRHIYRVTVESLKIYKKELQEFIDKFISYPILVDIPLIDNDDKEAWVSASKDRKLDIKFYREI